MNAGRLFQQASRVLLAFEANLPQRSQTRAGFGRTQNEKLVLRGGSRPAVTP